MSMLKRNNIIGFTILFIIIQINFLLSIESKIPEIVKRQELEIIMNARYYTEVSREFQEYYSQNYRDDLISFYVDIINNKKIPDETLLFLYSELLRFGKVEFLEKILNYKFKKQYSQELISSLKLQLISEAVFDLHRNNSKNKELWDTLYWQCRTESIESYNNLRNTPDFLFDGDRKTSWRIKNINNKDECSLYLPAPGLKKNRIKILSGNHEENKSFYRYYRPKKISLTLQGYTYMNNKETKNDNVYQDEFILKDSMEYQEIIFKPSVFLSIFERYNSYSIKLEILDYYKGEIANCDIAELRVEPLAN